MGGNPHRNDVVPFPIHFIRRSPAADLITDDGNFEHLLNVVSV